MWKLFLANKSGIPIDVCSGLADAPTLISESLRTTDAHWRSSEITTATTTTIIPANPSESLLLTDLIVILSKKVVGATIIVRFSDGTNTQNLFTLDAGTEPFRFNHLFQGGIRGWKEANLQVVTDDTTTLSVMAGYVHLTSKATKSYSIWNAER